MIQEIANFSRGASIKILSNRRMEKEQDANDIIVSIAGSFGAIQDATCMIIEQIECFKQGGPVLINLKLGLKKRKVFKPKYSPAIH
jgi:hypothetical protein